MNDRRKFHLPVLGLILLALGYGSYHVLLPFARPLAWAGVLTTVFYPLYALFLQHMKWPPLASAATVLVVLFVIIGPISFLAVMLVNELTLLASSGVVLPNFNSMFNDPRITWLLAKFGPFVNIRPEDLPALMKSGFANMGTSLIGGLQAGTQNLLLAVIDFLLTLVAMFFMFQDAKAFLEWIGRQMPFSDRQRERLSIMVKDIVISTIYGGLAVAFVQAVIAGVTFYFLDLDSFVLLGFAVGITSFIPMVGTALVWVPVAIYLVVEGMVPQAMVLTFVGVAIIAMVDNVLRPLIIKGRVKLHTLLIFFSVIGGMKLFGFLGLIAGPMCIALFMAVLDIVKEGPDSP